MNKTIEPNGKFVGQAANVVPIKANSDLSQIDAARAYIEQSDAENLLTTEHGEILLYTNNVWAVLPELAVIKELTDIFESMGTTPNASKVKGALAFVKSETYRDQELNPSCETIGVANGELVEKDGKWQLLPHNRQNYRTSLLPVEYDPSADCPLFKETINDLFNEGNADAESKKILTAQIFGYAMTTDCRYEKFFMFKGSGANGKSLLLFVLEKLMGHSNIASVDPTQFSNKFQVAYLQGRLVNIVTELRENLEIDDGSLKRITSGEPITAEQKYKPPFTFRSFAKCIFATNHLPRTKDVTPAFFRRAIIVEFNRIFKNESDSDFDASAHGVMDVLLKTKLLDELPGILNLALKGLAKLRRDGKFVDCESSRRLVSEWNETADYILQFANEKLVRDDSCRLLVNEVYTTYVEWCQSAGVRNPMTRNNFGRRMTDLHYERLRSNGATYFLDVRNSFQP